jgi:pilus assembly protein Flp/PilA
MNPEGVSRARGSTGMASLQRLLRRGREFVTNEDGPSVVEYAVMLGLIVLVSIAAITSVGMQMYSIYDVINASIPE